MTIETHPIVPVGYDETREWLAKYPHGAVASLIRTDRRQVGPRRPTLLGLYLSVLLQSPLSSNLRSEQ